MLKISTNDGHFAQANALGIISNDPVSSLIVNYYATRLIVVEIVLEQRLSDLTDGTRTFIITGVSF
jgi:hypothetical protein